MMWEEQQQQAEDTTSSMMWEDTREDVGDDTREDTRMWEDTREDVGWMMWEDTRCSFENRLSILVHPTTTYYNGCTNFKRAQLDRYERLRPGSKEESHSSTSSIHLEGVLWDRPRGRFSGGDPMDDSLGATPWMTKIDSLFSDSGVPK